jgi:MFS family permease
MVSLVQAAMSLPMFVFALPAGALADIIDKHRFIIGLEILITAVYALFAALLAVCLVTPATLLLFMFLTGAFSAAWHNRSTAGIAHKYEY